MEGLHALVPSPKDTLGHAIGCQWHYHRRIKTLPHWNKFASTVDDVIGIDYSAKYGDKAHLVDAL